jgi:hypothetical protein
MKLIKEMCDVLYEKSTNECRYENTTTWSEFFTTNLFRSRKNYDMQWYEPAIYYRINKPGKLCFLFCIGIKRVSVELCNA